jgi:hypothetical protein
MVFFQEFCMIWSTIELFMATTHLFVLLGFKNSKLWFIRRQQNYFLFDASTHLTNALLYSPAIVGYPIYLLWIYAVAVHLYYFRNLMINPLPSKKQNPDEKQTIEDNSDKISKIFHWSCIDSTDTDRFDIFKYGQQIAETIIDVFLHFMGFYFAFQNIDSVWYRITAIIAMTALVYRQMINLKYFMTDPKMMPKPLQKFFANATNTTNKNQKNGKKVN